MPSVVALNHELTPHMESVNSEVKQVLERDRICLLRIMPKFESSFGMLIMRKEGTQAYYMYDGASRLTRSDNPYITLLNYGLEFHSNIMNRGQHPIGIDVEINLPGECLEGMEEVLKKTKL